MVTCTVSLICSRLYISSVIQTETIHRVKWRKYSRTFCYAIYELLYRNFTTST